MLQGWREIFFFFSKLLHSVPSEVALRLKYKWALKASQWLHLNDYSVFPGLMEEKWWKFLHYVQLDLEEENNFKRQMRHSSLFTLCPRRSFSPVSVHQCFPARELLKCIKKGRSDVPVRILALTTSSVFFKKFFSFLLRTHSSFLVSCYFACPFTVICQ